MKFELRAWREGDETRNSIGRPRSGAEGHRPISASDCRRTGSSHRSVPPIHKSWGRSFADHWSSIRRPIGKVPTKISNVSSQIIKHQPDTQRGRAPTFAINPDFAAASRIGSRGPAPSSTPKKSPPHGHVCREAISVLFPHTDVRVASDGDRPGFPSGFTAADRRVAPVRRVVRVVLARISAETRMLGNARSGLPLDRAFLSFARRRRSALRARIETWPRRRYRARDHTSSHVVVVGRQSNPASFFNRLIDPGHLTGAIPPTHNRYAHCIQHLV